MKAIVAVMVLVCAAPCRGEDPLTPAQQQVKVELERVIAAEGRDARLAFRGKEALASSVLESAKKAYGKKSVKLVTPAQVDHIVNSLALTSMHDGNAKFYSMSDEQLREQGGPDVSEAATAAIEHTDADDPSGGGRHWYNGSSVVSSETASYPVGPGNNLVFYNDKPLARPNHR